MALGFGFNKAKVLASAEKFVQQGKLPNAIAEYEKVAREDPKDVTVLNTIGDLYARLGDNEHAVHYFKKVGDQYAQSGFTVKAIAVYKKLSRLAPSNAEHITKLAELYTQQGLFSDARAQYMLMADAHLRAGENSQAARVFQKILELDPENAATQAKLADLYMKLGKKDEALKIYSSAAEALYARGSLQAAEDALNKVITLDPHNAAALLLRGMMAADSGDHASAIRYLDEVADRDSRPEVLRALLRARVSLDELDGAEAEAQTLLDRHNDATGISSLAEWYVNHDQVSSAVALYERNAAKLSGSDAAALQGTLYSLIDKSKDNPEALNRLQRLIQTGGEAQPDGEASPNAETLEIQAHAFAQKGEYAQARDLYKKLSELEPENVLHNQNYRQMLAKLGEDSATRILTPEEAAQALMVEELDQSAVVVQQKYDPPTETAIESALTDAELYVSYNVPSKAIAPLEAALPLAPKDITLNQRLATLYARAERYADAARMCQNLSDIYRELGHANESARYQDASRKYALKAGITPAVVSARTAEAAPGPVIEKVVSASSAASSLTSDAPAAEEPVPSVQEFSFDVTEPVIQEPEPATQPVEVAQRPELQVYPAEDQLHSVEAEPEIEVEASSEWEDMLSVEVEESESTKVEMANQAALEEDTQKLESELVAEPSAASDPAAKEPEGGSGVCYLVDDKVQEVQFYISQQMWQAARNALNELTEIAPESPQLPELMAAIAAGSTPEISQKPDEVSPEPAIEPDRTPVMEQAVAANFLPPPFAAPAPPTNSAFMDPFAARMPAATAASAVPAAKQTRVTGKSPADEESVLDLGDDLAAPTAQVPAPRAGADSFAATQSTEDILTDLVHDLESTELKDFLPKPHAEPAITAPPVAAPAPAQATNGGVQSQEAGSVLADILSDLQEETAEPNESEEDPETHYNLGIAFKEMGLLDEAIGELQKVCRAVDKGQMFSQPIQAYTWLAQCLVDKGAPEAAVRWYQKALKIPALDDSSRCAIYYDLAAAYEAFGDTKSALANFMEVYGSNIDFRDVASRIRTLKS